VEARLNYTEIDCHYDILATFLFNIAIKLAREEAGDFGISKHRFAGMKNKYM
jgi:hypothetical protein